MMAAPGGFDRDAPTNSRRRLASNALRVCVGTLFAVAGLSKLVAPASTAAVVASRNLPAPVVIGAAVGVVEAVAGVLLAVGWKARWMAAALSVFVVVASGIFHSPIVLVGPRAVEIGVDAGVLFALYVIATRSGSADRA